MYQFHNNILPSILSQRQKEAEARYTSQLSLLRGNRHVLHHHFRQDLWLMELNKLTWINSTNHINHIGLHHSKLCQQLQRIGAHIVSRLSERDFFQATTAFSFTGEDIAFPPQAVPDVCLPVFSVLTLNISLLNGFAAEKQLVAVLR